MLNGFAGDNTVLRRNRSYLLEHEKSFQDKKPYRNLASIHIYDSFCCQSRNFCTIHLAKPFLNTELSVYRWEPLVLQFSHQDTICSKHRSLRCNATLNSLSFYFGCDNPSQRFVVLRKSWSKSSYCGIGLFLVQVKLSTITYLRHGQPIPSCHFDSLWASHNCLGLLQKGNLSQAL